VAITTILQEVTERDDYDLRYLVALGVRCEKSKFWFSQRLVGTRYSHL